MQNEEMVLGTRASICKNGKNVAQNENAGHDELCADLFHNANSSMLDIERAGQADRIALRKATHVPSSENCL
jgi:hypothetical protein